MLQLRNFNTLNTTSNKVYLNKQGRWKIKNKPSIKSKRNKMKEIELWLKLIIINNTSFKIFEYYYFHYVYLDFLYTYIFRLC